MTKKLLVLALITSAMGGLSEGTAAAAYSGTTIRSVCPRGAGKILYPADFTSGAAVFNLCNLRTSQFTFNDYGIVRFDVPVERRSSATPLTVSAVLNNVDNWTSATSARTWTFKNADGALNAVSAFAHVTGTGLKTIQPAAVDLPAGGSAFLELNVQQGGADILMIRYQWLANGV